MGSCMDGDVDGTMDGARVGTWMVTERNNGAKHGDLQDITNLIAVATLDAYVSNDEGARDLSDLIFPNKTSICLDDFINLIKSHDSIS